MLNELPTSSYLMLLLVLLPGIWLLGKLIAKKAYNDENISQILSIGLAISIWLSSVHIVALLSKSFINGLLFGTIMPSILGYFYFLKRDVSLNFKFNTTKGPILTVLACTVMILPALFLWDFHDKIGAYSSHFSIAAQILNNIYPPRDLAFSFLTLKYHYGIDTLFAMVSATGHLSLDIAIDITTLILWVYTLFLFGCLGKKLYGEKVEIPAILIGAFAGGLPWILGKASNLANALLGIYDIKGSYINPPFTSYFFQHPWTIGAPVALIILILLATIGERKNSLFFSLIMLISFIVLGFSNTTLFMTMGAGIVAVSGFKFLLAFCKKEPVQKYVLEFAPIIVAGITAVFLSGFTDILLHNHPYIVSRIIPACHGIAGGLKGSIMWNLATFGLLLPAGLVGLIFKRPLRELFIVLIVGGIVIVNSFTYSASWDIVKFATLAQLILAISALSLISYVRSTRFGKTLAYLLLLPLIVSGIAYHFAFWFNLPNNPFPVAIWRSPISKSINHNELKAIGWVRKHISAGDIVLSNPDNSLAYAYSGGFPQLWLDSVTLALGFSNQLIDPRTKLTKTLPLDSEPYFNAKVRWVIIDRNKVCKITNLVRNWKNEGVLQYKVSFGSVDVYKLLAPKVH